MVDEQLRAAVLGIDGACWNRTEQWDAGGSYIMTHGADKTCAGSTDLTLTDEESREEMDSEWSPLLLEQVLWGL